MNQQMGVPSSMLGELSHPNYEINLEERNENLRRELRGYRGRTIMEAGYVYAPYIPFTISSGITAP